MGMSRTSWLTLLIGAATAVLLGCLVVLLQHRENRAYWRRLTKQKKTEQILREYHLALMRLDGDCADCPVVWERLPTSIFQNVGCSNWNGPYLEFRGCFDEQDVRHRILSDAYGNALSFSLMTNVVRIRSRGPDGLMSTDDDVYVDYVGDR